MWKVISIIVILLAALFVYTNFDSKQAVQLRVIQNDIELLNKAINIHHTRTGKYPEKLNDLQGNYMLNVPIDPDGNPYKYAVSEDGLSFVVEIQEQ
jgi:hypothetical protein